jgi:hypothetical protein
MSGSVSRAASGTVYVAGWSPDAGRSTVKLADPSQV